MPQVTDLSNVKAYGLLQVSGRKLSSRARILAATGTILSSEAPIQYVDCNGVVRNIDLPAAANNVGLVFTIKNISAGAFALTVRDALAATIGTLAQTITGNFHCDGVVWRQI